MQQAIEATGVVKRFGRTTALAGLDLEVGSGAVTALLGPNGAGKTTFVSLVATLARPDAGSLSVFGHDVRRHPAAVRQLVALAGQHAAVEPMLTGRENLEMVARLFGRTRADARRAAAAVLDRLDLGDAAGRQARTYSGGMRRRLDLGASLVGQPRLLLLDEPTTGLDPRSRLELWDIIRELVAQGTDVLLTTQYLEEADHLAASIAIIDHGRVVAAGTPAELKRRAGQSVVEVRVREADAIAHVATALRAISAAAPTIDEPTRTVRVTLDVDAARVFSLLRPLDGDSGAIDEVSVRQPTLDEAFLAFTGAHTEEVA